MFGLLVLAAAGCRPTADAPSNAAGASVPPFTEVAEKAGLDFRQRSGKKQALDIVQTSAGGCGVLDYDNDGWLDLYLVQGEHQAGPRGGNRLYRNRQDGTFEDVTEKAGVRGRGYGMGCAAGDFDADGWTDLYVCNNGTNELFRNRGDGTFEEVGTKVGADVKGCSIGAVFADLDGDSWPDLYVARYVKIRPDTRLICTQNGIPTSCDPQSYEVEPSVFLRSVGGKRFEDRTSATGLSNEGRGMGLLVADVNEDGRPDLFVANDTTANSLLMSGAEGKFRNEALLAGVAYGELGVSEANMGSDFGDYNGDGRLDLFVGVMQDRSSLLFRNDGKGLFTLATRTASLDRVTAPVVTWGAAFLDWDNDGDLDLFQANGHTHDTIAKINPQVTYPQPRQLFENLGDGTFRDLTPTGGPALTQPAAGRGAAFGDLDNDGDVDVLVNNLDGPPMLLMNGAERRGQHWVRVRLTGKAPNRVPEGTLVKLQAGERTLVRHLHRAYSYASTNDPRVHFGLGAHSGAVTLTVTWPGGREQVVQVPAVDREVEVRQP